MKSRALLLAATCVLAVFPVAHAAADTLRIWRDCSTSMSEGDYRLVVDTLLKSVRPFVQIDRIELVRFSCGDARLSTALPQEFRLADASAKPPNGVMAIFRAAVVAEASAAEEARANALEHMVRPVLLEAPEAIARCTRFDSLGARMLKENRPLSVVVTDGWVDCPQRPADGRFSSATIVVVLPRREDAMSDDATGIRRRVRDMERFFPGATVIEGYEVATVLAQQITRTVQPTLTGDK
jgi:hypothetical protein